MQRDVRLIYSSLFLCITGCSSHSPSVGETVAEYQDCETCPAMVIVPKGSFVMGSPDSEAGRAGDEGPQHKVHISKSFALGKYEVTRGQFRAFVEATNYRTTAEKNGNGCVTLNAKEKGNDREWTAKQNWRNAELFGLKQQSDDHPALCITKHDALAYIDWLNETQSKAGNGIYRLPTEAEWEYAARAGSNTKFSFGSDITSLCQHGNGGDLTSLPDGITWKEKVDCKDGYVYTAPVGSYQANRFDLYDMSGNVWEWTEDCWHDNYNNAPTKGEAWKDENGGDCTHGVARGGAWWYHLQDLRVAFRLVFNTSMPSHMAGFRVAQDLP